MLEGPGDPSQVIDNKDLNPGSSFGFQVLAGEGVGPGVWMYHCHVQFHSDGGMVGLFLVRNADGSMPAGAEEAIHRFHGHGARPRDSDARTARPTADLPRRSYGDEARVFHRLVPDRRTSGRTTSPRR